MSKINELNDFEINYLEAQSEPGLSYHRVRPEKGTLHLEATLAPQEIRMILIETLYD